jgi:hypothetical protein
VCEFMIALSFRLCTQKKVELGPTLILI